MLKTLSILEENEGLTEKESFVQKKGNKIHPQYFNSGILSEYNAIGLISILSLYTNKAKTVECLFFFLI